MKDEANPIKDLIVEEGPLVGNKKNRFSKRGQKLNEQTNDAKMSAVLQKRRRKLYECMTLERSKTEKILSHGVFEYFNGKVRITQQRGKLLARMGHHVNGNHYLDPEEAYYLLEKSNLSITTSKDEHIQTVQQALGLFLNHFEPENPVYTLEPVSHDAISYSTAPLLRLTDYLVYAHLKKTGFIVRRHVLKHYQEDVTHQFQMIQETTERSPAIQIQMRSFFVREKEKLLKMTKVSKQRKSKVSSTHQEALYDVDTASLDDTTSTNAKWWSVPSSSLAAPSSSSPPLLPIEPLSAHLSSFPQLCPSSPTTLTASSVASASRSIQFDVWSPSLYKRTGKSRLRPSFAVVVAAYTSAFPSVSSLEQMTRTIHPTPLYFCITEGGQHSFVQLDTVFSVPSTHELREFD